MNKQNSYYQRQRAIADIEKTIREEMVRMIREEMFEKTPLPLSPNALSAMHYKSNHASY